MLIRKTNPIPIEIFRTIVTVADTRSYVRAASRLGISNPAVVAHISRVTAVVGSKLFRETTDGLAPTEVGKRAIPIAREILALHEQFKNLMSAS